MIMAMNEKQIFFYVGKKRIETIENKAKEEGRKLTLKEEREKEQILEMLFGSIVKFGVSLAKKRLSLYRKDSDAMADIRQDMACIFFNKLPDYDPTRTTPTTYFLRYFNQVITEYILNYSQHMSQYDSHNVSIVRGAIKFYEEKGIAWDEMMIANKTGLSLKVVKYSLKLASNSIYANVDDTLDMASQIPTPEENYIEREKKITLYNAIREQLDPDELKFFLYKINLDGKERSYQCVANDLGMQVRDVKKKWSGLIARLNSDRKIQSFKRRKDPQDVSLHLNDAPADFDERLYFSGLDSLHLGDEKDGNN